MGKYLGLKGNCILVLLGLLNRKPIVKRTVKRNNNQILCFNQLSNNLFASSTYENKITIWYLSEQICTYVTIISGHMKRVSCLFTLSNGNLVSGSEDTTIKIWNHKIFNCISTLIGHSQLVDCIIQLSNGDLASYSNDSLKIWDIETCFTCKINLVGHSMRTSRRG